MNTQRRKAKKSQWNIQIDHDLKRRIKAFAALRDLTIERVIADGMTRHIDERKAAEQNGN